MASFECVSQRLDSKSKLLLRETQNIECEIKRWGKVLQHNSETHQHQQQLGENHDLELILKINWYCYVADLTTENNLWADKFGFRNYWGKKCESTFIVLKKMFAQENISDQWWWSLVNRQQQNMSKLAVTWNINKLEDDLTKILEIFRLQTK